METIFTKIIKGEIPCYKIAEDEKFIAFLDISPIAEGHTLVVPKVQVDYIFNLDDSMLSELVLFAKRVAKAVEKNISCLRIGVAVIGIDVPHTHIHLVPINQVGDLDFKKKRVELSSEQMKTIAEKISASFE